MNPDDAIECRRRERLDGGHRLWFVLENGGNQTCLALPVKGLFPGEHLVEHGAKREDIGTSVSLLAFQLLGRHVLERAQDRALHGQARRRRRQHRHATTRRTWRSTLCEAEVEELRSGLRQHDVPRLQISMDDAGTMGFVERVCDLHGVPQREVEGKCASAESIRERLAFQIPHDQEVDAIVMTDVMERADVRMIEVRDGARFALEPLAERRVGRELFGEHLDGDNTIQSGVAGLLDLAHPARAERRYHLVRTDSETGCKHLHNGCGACRSCHGTGRLAAKFLRTWTQWRSRALPKYGGFARGTDMAWFASTMSRCPGETR